MKHDLKAMTRKELEKLLADIDKQLARVEGKERKLALAAAERAMKKHGFSLADITGTDGTPKKATRKTAKKPKNSGKPKYANPNDKKQTWTGKGRRPDWFLKAMEAGKTPEELTV
ncbi:H-NS histone family protein [Cognatiyoonia sp. IB215182]|uniref:H-NS histone family protein n=1 Tax=Cognatiyoonia sp. IB215182 TaxID=3097353 RepID=UPI002A0D1A2A|nr:H-NS histone family protein [Cognatiyoonia sp. IB215182]MDX8353976.1 H-NS histone family protein [Cognatiyoonia sp. IB215182]